MLHQLHHVAKQRSREKKVKGSRANHLQVHPKESITAGLAKSQGVRGQSCMLNRSKQSLSSTQQLLNYGNRSNDVCKIYTASRHFESIAQVQCNTKQLQVY
jgi:hypothetical protein